MVDIDAVAAALDAVAYTGSATIEQDRIAGTGAPLDDLARSVAVIDAAWSDRRAAPRGAVMGADTVRIGIVGSGFIAGVHSAAYRCVAGTYSEAPRDVQLRAAADVDGARADALAGAWGWQRSHTDWREITRADDIDVVAICVPNLLHAEVAGDVLANGKHVICEKPIATTSEEARRMVAAAAGAGLVNQVCFYYRVWLAISWARQLIDAGELGTVKHWRGWMFLDYAASPRHDLGWRARLDESGAGALGDLGSHVIDITRYLCGEIPAVSATMRLLIDRAFPPRASTTSCR